MGIRGWLRDRLAQSTASPSQGLDLLTGHPGALELPELAGIALTGAVRPWSVARLELIMREAAVNPSPATLQAARQARHCLSVFWLAVPSDQLAEFYAGPIGQLPLGDRRDLVESTYTIGDIRRERQPRGMTNSTPVDSAMQAHLVSESP